MLLNRIRPTSMKKINNFLICHCVSQNENRGNGRQSRKTAFPQDKAAKKGFLQQIIRILLFYC